jgi:hypothetical protein
MDPTADEHPEADEVEGFWWRHHNRGWWRHRHPFGYAGPPDPQAQIDMLAVSPVAKPSDNWGAVSFKP